VSLLSETLPAGAMWSMRIPRHRSLVLTTRGAGANVSALFFNATQPLDRLNVPDTLKALHTAKIHQGHILMSDMGHAMVSVTEDSLGWHDPLAGHIDAEMVREKFGEHGYQQYRNRFYRNARDNFLIELGKHGLGLRDIVANVNFFSRVNVDADGRMSLAEGHAPAHASISLRTEMDLLVVLANCPHPLSPAGDYPSVPVQVEIFASEAPTGEDFCRNFRPECGRALALTERLFL